MYQSLQEGTKAILENDSLHVSVIRHEWKQIIKNIKYL